MTYQFIMANQDPEPLHLLAALAGPSACGKTYSAMELATGLSEGQPFAVIDTEAKRALHYRNRFQFAHLDFTPVNDEGEMVGYPPERYIEAIDAAEKAGYPAIVVDSFSHVWEGIGGVLEMQAKELHRLAGDDPQRQRNMQISSWAEPKKRYRRLLHRIIQCRAHLILCIRAKDRVGAMKGGRMEYVGKSKIRREDLPYDVAADKDLVFEMTTSLLLTPEQAGVPLPLKLNDEHMHAFPQGQRISARSGEAMLEWSRSGGSGDKELLDHARTEARKGAEAMNAMWKKLSKAERAKLAGIMDELRGLVADAGQPDDDAPFGESAAASADDGDDAPALTPEQEEALRAKIRLEQEEALAKETA